MAHTKEMAGTTSRHSDSVGDDACEKATGRRRDAWRKLLDDAGAAAWDHPTIATWLREQHDIDGWWAQGITVDYEQHIGRRRPGQRADGTFEGSVSRNLPVDMANGLDGLTASVRAATGCEAASVNTRAKNYSARWTLPDGRTLSGMVSPLADARCRVVLTMAKLDTEAELTDAKQQMKAWLPVV